MFLKMDCHVAFAPRNDEKSKNTLVITRRAKARRGDPQNKKLFLEFGRITTGN